MKKHLQSKFVNFFKILRKSSNDGQIINAVFSTRRLVQLSEALEFGETLTDALQFEVFSRYDRHELEILREIAFDIWG